VQLARETTCLSTPYTLPDGQTISIGPERFWAPEVLFNPALAGSESDGLCDAIHDCIHSLPIDTRLGMYEAVLLSGGTLMLPGASTRVERELRQLYLHKTLQARPVPTDSCTCAWHLRMLAPPGECARWHSC
jgi:actin-related protein 2